MHKSYQEALMNPEWKQVMDDEMDTLMSRQTWDLVPTSSELPAINCRWVFTMKYRPDGTMDRYKAHLAAWGFTQTYGVDYLEIFSHVARLNSIHILFSLAVNQQWSMFQLDVNNAFLYGGLEEIYME